MIFLDFTPAQIAGIAVALVVGITFHEFSHAFIADQLGDYRPRALGRVTLNPVAHIDPIGALVFLIAGFGWGKPVPVNIYALRPGRIGMALVSAGGPIANVVVAIAAAYPTIGGTAPAAPPMTMFWSVERFSQPV